VIGYFFFDLLIVFIWTKKKNTIVHNFTNKIWPKNYDTIVNWFRMIRRIDCLVLFMAKAGPSRFWWFSKNGWRYLGGDCLNDGCVPTRHWIHVSRIGPCAKIAANFGLMFRNKLDIKKAIDYVVMNGKENNSANEKCQNGYRNREFECWTRLAKCTI